MLASEKMTNIESANRKEYAVSTHDASTGQIDEDVNCLRKFFNCLCWKHRSVDLNGSQMRVITKRAKATYCLSNAAFDSSNDANTDDSQAAFTPNPISANNTNTKISKYTKPEVIKEGQCGLTSQEMLDTGSNQALPAVENTFSREDQDHANGLEQQHKEKQHETNSMFNDDNQKLGLSDLEKQEYFRKFSENKETAAKVVRLLERNINLETLCENASYCKILCAYLEHFLMLQCQCDESPSVTLTHLLSVYLCKAFIAHSSQITSNLHFLLRVSEIACEKIRMETSTFKDLSCHETFQQSELQSSFLAVIMENESSTGDTDKFLHQPVQVFLAAVGLFLTTTPKELITLVEKHYSEKQEQSVTFLRFLFGLCSANSSDMLEEYLGPFPGESICDLTDFLKSRIEVGIHNMNNEKTTIELLNTLCYLYETQNEELARITIGSVKQLAFGGWKPVKLTPNNCTAIAMGLELCNMVEDLNLNKCYIEDSGSHRLMPVLHKCKVVRLNENKLSDTSAKGFSDALTRPDCQIHTLELWDNQFTNVGAEHLASALRINRTLKVLVLSHNRLEDSGVIQLTAALRDSGSKIKILRLACNSFTTFGKRQLRSQQQGRACVEVWV
ncbi:NACHT, LRR and PYD domains-containing protein 6-like isoform X2 [Scyliorhinus canicula]|uniref:NACHT, LRR and PYD domains-containing protein 6-like isoform X2 n=1 Tax=Scyliorhinus canicula TaxID=7830 RepID=UPI0018F44E95|nr:NACHT, LRR and PYD domains-containing protein 6-like isoform X2 [Scyliorhinus canicula]